MEMVKRRQKTLKAASLELGISYRQAKRVYQRSVEGRPGIELNLTHNFFKIML
jgi:hypothetical protein